MRTPRNPLVPVIALLGLGLAACPPSPSPTDGAGPDGDGAAPIADLAGPSNDAAPTDGPAGANGDLAIAGAEVHASIGATGGTLAHPDGAKLVIPAGALAADVTLSIESVATPRGRGVRFVGPVFRFGPPGQVFAKPVAVTVPYVPAQLQGVSAAAVRLYHGDDAGEAFIPVPSTVDEPGARVTGGFDSFSRGAAALPDPDKIIPLPFTPRDLAFGAVNGTPYVWVMGDGKSASMLSGAYLYRVDATTGAVAPWIGESMVFQGLDGPTWVDGWGVWIDPGDSRAFFTGSLQNGFQWTINQVALGGAPDLKRSWQVLYSAPKAGAATTLHGLTRNAAGAWATFQGCGQLFQEYAAVMADPNSTGACPNRQPVLIGNQVFRLNDCNYASSPGREFFQRFGPLCASFVDLAPSATGPNDIVATDAHQRVVYLARNVDLPHATAVGIAGYHDMKGSRDGSAYDADPSLRALFSDPGGVAVTSNGTIYVADTGNHAVRRITATGALAWSTVVTIYGGPMAGTLASPSSVTLEPDGRALWIADAGNKRLVRVLLP